MPPQRASRRGKAAKAAKAGENQADEGTSGECQTSRPQSQNNEHHFQVLSSKKDITCVRRGSSQGAPRLIFTHGASGGLSNAATQLFMEGFSWSLPVIGFEGSMNLKSRTTSFHAVIEHENADSVALGGRSMGARAALLAAREHTTTRALILVSYPLLGQNGSVRDQILLEIDPSIEVLFISGDGDNMCSLGRLNEVRSSMKAKTWLAVVQGADHGMTMKPKSVTDALRVHTGKLAAAWLQSRSSNTSECLISWDADKKELQETWSAGSAGPKATSKGWTSKTKRKAEIDEESTPRKPTKRGRKK
jgi:pimeloyl-ACP methyl ester carboxylesterase